MADEDQAEDRLRQLLRDDRWSLPAWADTQARVRKAARRQQVTAAAAGAATLAAVTAATVVSLTLTGTAPSKTPTVTGPTPAAARTAIPRRHYTLPPVGAPGFPTATYPAPGRRLRLRPLGRCPASEGLQPFTTGNAAAARALIPKLGRSFTDDLRLTDRVFWPTILIGWQHPPGHGPARVGSRGTLYAGPLTSYHQSDGPPDFTRPISAGCGTRLARDTWMIVNITNAGYQREWLFLNRRGHVLLYYHR